DAQPFDGCGGIKTTRIGEDKLGHGVSYNWLCDPGDSASGRGSRRSASSMPRRREPGKRGPRWFRRLQGLVAVGGGKLAFSAAHAEQPASNGGRSKEQRRNQHGGGGNAGRNLPR